jgi:EmrB/QacA subfamily drug resistance transporter
MQEQNQKWLVFVGLALSIMMVDIDVTAANLAVSDIIHDLNLTVSTGQWIIDGYSMAATVLMAFAGRCGDIYGHKKNFLIALVVFAISSCAVGLSQGAWSIVVSRILQGACIAFTFPIATVIARKVFPKEQHGFVISLLISIAGISQALGPAFGGIMLSIASWRWIFLINIPLALLAYYLINRFLEKDAVNPKEKLDVSALLFLIVGLFSLMTGFNEINQFGLASVEFISLMIIAIVALFLFVRSELKGKNPLLDLKLLINHSLARIITARLLINFVYFSWLFGISLLLQKVFNYSSLFSGTVLLSLTLVTAILAIPVGKLIDYVGFKKPLLIGTILMTIANIFLSLPIIDNSLMMLIISLLIAGLSVSLLIPSSATAVVGLVTMEKTGAAMGVFFTCGFLGNSLGVAISGSLLAEYTIKQGFSYAMIVCAFLAFVSFLLCLSLGVAKESS